MLSFRTSALQGGEHVSVALAHVSPETDYLTRFRSKQEEIASDANTARTGFTERMAELVAMQQQEILRLQKVLHDATALPERYPVAMAVSSVANERGQVKHVLLATASDRSVWLMENFSPLGRSDLFKWGRVPNLPQASDEADASSRVAAATACSFRFKG